MSQYYKIVNLDKRQFLDPHKFGDGLKLMEFGNSGCGTLFGLTVLLADGNGRDGGDLDSDDPIIGSWAGDRVVVAGEYADGGRFLDDEPIGNLEKTARAHYTEDYAKPQNVTLYAYASDHFEDVSDRVIRAIAADKVHQHPLARLNLGETGVRNRPAWEEGGPP